MLGSGYVRRGWSKRAFRGYTLGMVTTKQEPPLGSLMGIQDYEGGVRQGQSCFMWTYPTGGKAARAKIREQIQEWGKPEVLDNSMGEPRGPIDAVMEQVMLNYIQYIPSEEDGFSDQLDGLQAGAGFIYGVLQVAKRKGATLAYVTITSIHHVYYGT